MSLAPSPISLALVIIPCVLGFTCFLSVSVVRKELRNLAASQFGIVPLSLGFGFFPAPVRSKWDI